MSAAVLAAVPAAPILPAISTLGAVLAFALAFALSVMWFQILRGPLVRLASLSILRVHPFGWLHAVISNVDHWLNATVAATERAVTWSLHALMLCISTGAKLTEDTARATWQALEWERRHTTRHVAAPVPQSIDPRIKTLEREYKGIEAELKQLERREQAQRGAGAAAGTIDHAQLQRGIDRLAKQVGHLAHEVDALGHADTHAGAKAKPGTQAIPRTKPRAVPNVRRPARTWQELLTRKASAFLVLSALAPLGLSFLRCPSLLRMGKRFGCRGFSLLEELLAASFVPFILTDACKIMHLIEGIAVKVEPEIAALVLGIEGFVCGGVDNLPSGIVPGDLKRVGASASAL